MTDWNLEVVAAFLRAAYGKGYCDALTEDAPGSLCHEHGYRIPARKPARRPTAVTAARRARRGYDARVGVQSCAACDRAFGGSRLAIFVVYTALAGAASPSLRPSTVARPYRQRAPRRQGRRARSAVTRTAGGMHFVLKDIQRRTPRASPSSTAAASPTSSAPARTSSVDGTLRHGVFVATPGSLITKCPDHYAPASPPRPNGPARARSAPPRLRPRRVRARRGLVRRVAQRRRLALSAQNALLAAFPATLVAAAVLLVALGRHDITFVYVAAAHEPQAAARLRALRVLGRTGGLAPALAARADRLRRRSPSGSTAARAS